MANELALRDRIATSSRFGPTDVDREPPICDGPMGIGPNARLAVHLEGTLDGRSMGTIELAGERDVGRRSLAGLRRDDPIWGCTERRSSATGHGSAEPFTGWRRATPSEIGDADLDLTAFREARHAGSSGPPRRAGRR